MSIRVAIAFLVLLIAPSVLCAGCASPAPGLAAPTPAVPVTTTSGATVVPGTTSVAITLTARDIAFDKSTLSAPAPATVALTFINQDAGIPHNFALYTDASASTTIFKGAIINGPGTTTYTFTAPGTPGTYFYRCDPHPETMTGLFLVT